ncbi:MAG: sigma-70 family RNA polymerase sigma factor [Saprospiraceae bacterium]|nr:sigma-70 family RNA polymerase sigma factor [Saprospiraceae bacterium]
MVENFHEPVSESDFKRMLLELQRRDQAAWSSLVSQLRRVTLPWIAKRLGILPSCGLLGKKELALEIFADSLSKYFDLFEKGTFTKPEEFQSLMFKVAELKTLEALRRLGKEALIYRPQNEADFERALAHIPDWSDEDELARERAKTLQQHLASLKTEERILLQRFYEGEKMSQLAVQMNTTEENLRKRKQRALERLKQLFGANAPLILLFSQTWPH